LQGDATADEAKIIDSWYERMGRNKGDIGEEEDIVASRYWSGIEHSMHKGQKRGQMVVLWATMRVAASFLLITAASLSLWSGGEKVPLIDQAELQAVASTNRQQIFSSGENTREFMFPDGSTVTLEPRSVVRFLNDFNKTTRPVWLEGAAFFDICPDEMRPFFVHASDLTTKVLGTSFRVRAFEYDKDVTVAVQTGKVFVTTADGNKVDTNAHEIILTPNQKVVYDKLQHRLARTIVDKPQIILPEDEVRQMRFEGVAVPVILQAIEKVYGVDLVFDSAKFDSCKLTSIISDGELYNRLDIICKAIGASYTLHENHIVIDGDGCNTE
ncbi:MAG TPA: FecR domain-containing protein, partial [Chryseosolibacter sp.]